MIRHKPDKQKVHSVLQRNKAPITPDAPVSIISSLPRAACSLSGNDNGPSGPRGPAGQEGLGMRRVIFGTLVAFGVIGLLGLMMMTLSPGGFSAMDIALLALFSITLPWTVIGFWNALIGLGLMRFAPNAALAVNPHLPERVDRERARQSPRSRTAILSCIRNEDIGRVVHNLEAMLGELQDTGAAAGFALHVLSDSDWPALIGEEARAFERLKQRWVGMVDVHYRRRTDNPGFKAGNISEFLGAHGDNYDFMLVLDADSVMSADAVLRLRQMMEDNPQLGIVQSLVTGLPSASLFARIFQFGMRLGMRSYTLGSAWWQGDCGPYWGHNALIRVAPFKTHCELPKIGGSGPLSGWILSHDQVEAVLMRRAGYEVRVVPIEDGSFEENPPNLLEFIRRDLRWCHGNMQYFGLLRLKGLATVSRIQLVLAILMFIGSPAWLGFVCLSSLSYVLGYDGLAFRADTGMALFAIIMTMVFAPKLATIVDVLLDHEQRRRFGGAVRLVAGSFSEIIFAMLVAPVIAIAHTLFMGGLLLGRKGQWPAQYRDAAALPWPPLLIKLWPQTLFGALGFAWFAAALPMGFGAYMALPVIVGPVLAVVLGWATAWPQVGLASHRAGLWSVPEEIVPPRTILSLGLPVLEGHPAQMAARLAPRPSAHAKGTILEAAE
jgi:membrane glycosyltransferase